MLTGERCHTVNISSRHDTYSIKVETSSGPAGTSQICFGYFISFSMNIKIFKMSQTEVALTMKVFLHNIPYTDEENTDFEKTTTQKYTFLSQT